MKIRLGLVSNSSSSSFIIGAKKMPTEGELIKIFGAAKGSPLYALSVVMAQVMVGSLEEGRTKEELLSDWGVESEKGLPKEYKKVWAKGLKVFEGSVASDSDDHAERALVDVDINYESDDLVIYKEGGIQ